MLGLLPVHLVLIGVQLHLETCRPSVDIVLMSICRHIRQMLYCFPWHLYFPEHKPHKSLFVIYHPAFTVTF